MNTQKVAIVEDNPALLTVFVAMLRGFGFEVGKFENGLDFLAAVAESESFDLVILDYMMPEMDGLQTFREFRKLNSDTPAMMVTAMDSTDLVVEFMLIGGAGFVTKPVLSRAIFEIQVRQVLRHAANKKALWDAENARCVAEEAHRRERAFLSQMSHELRTPVQLMLCAAGGDIQNDLQGIQAQLQLLLAAAERGGPTLQAEILQILGVLLAPRTGEDDFDTSKFALLLGDAAKLKESAERLSRTATVVLDLARLTSGNQKVQSASLDLAEVVGHLIDAEFGGAHAGGLALCYESEGIIPLVSDRALIEQVVQNLLGNAIKFTPSGGAVCVRCWQEEGFAYVSVADTGCGIPAGEEQKIFGSFIQSSVANRHSGHGGSGLGLTLCQEIVSRLGGEIWVVPGRELGAEFIFKLPVAKGEVGV